MCTGSGYTPGVLICPQIGVSGLSVVLLFIPAVLFPDNMQSLQQKIVIQNDVMSAAGRSYRDASCRDNAHSSSPPA